MIFFGERVHWVIIFVSPASGRGAKVQHPLAKTTGAAETEDMINVVGLFGWVAAVDGGMGSSFVNGMDFFEGAVFQVIKTDDFIPRFAPLFVIRCVHQAAKLGHPPGVGGVEVLFSGIEGGDVLFVELFKVGRVTLRFHHAVPVANDLASFIF